MIDINGHELTTTTSKTPHGADRTNILLKLKDNERPKEIAYILNELRLIFIKKIRSKDHVNNCYTFNQQLMNGKLFDWIQLNDDFGVYKIRKSFIIENGKVWDNGAMGFEVQLLVPIQQIEQFKINKSKK